MSRLSRTPLVGVMFVVCFGFTALLMNTEAPREKSKRVLNDAGVNLSTNLDGSTVIGATFSRITITREIAQELLNYPDLKHIRVDDCEISKGVFPIFENFLQLESLVLQRDRLVSDSELNDFLLKRKLDGISVIDTLLSKTHFQTLLDGTLSNVTLQNCGKVSPEFVESLASQPQLKSLSCRGVSLPYRLCRQIKTERPQLLFSVRAAEILEFQQLGKAGVEYQINDRFDVVGLKMSSSVFAADPAFLKQYPLLEGLEITDSELEEPVMQTIGELDRMKYLSLERSTIAADGCKHLENMDRLAFLNLDGVNTQDGKDLSFPALPSLRHLQACSLNLSDVSLQQLQADSLVFASLGPNISEAGLRTTARSKSLMTLVLYGLPLDRKMTEAVGELERLLTLIAIECQIEEKHLPQLAEADRLRTLYLVNSNLSSAGLFDLKRIAPNLSVVR